MRAVLLIAALLCTSDAKAGVPGFVPRSSDAFVHFSALGVPKPEVPVGALWVMGFGPHGEGALPDNLETVRSLSSLTIDKDLELRLTAGVLSFLGIDPGMRRHFSARFSDLSIVRVKDSARLSGPTGEPRILAALKAGSIVVGADNTANLNIQNQGSASPLNGQLISGGRSNTSFEARDMIIAVRVAKIQRTDSSPMLLKPKRGLDDTLTIALEGFQLRISSTKCTAQESCAIGKVVIARAGNSQPLEATMLGGAFNLPIPIADGEGGLWEKLQLEPITPCAIHKAADCGSEIRFRATLIGTRMVDVAQAEVAKWDSR